MNNDKIPCCEISSEQSVEKECMTLCPFFVLLKKEDQALLPVSLPCCEPTTFYTIYYPFHSLAGILYGCKQSAAQERKKREKPLPRSYTVLCRFIYPNLSVRLKKVHGFYTVFSLFRTENCGLFCVFPTVFSPPR
jgi:hypothetical protein